MKDLIQTSQDNFLLASYGLLKVSGAGAIKLLQGQLTCDVSQISANNGSLAAQCNPQGRIISLFYLTKIKDDYVLIMPVTMLTIAKQALAKYAPFYKTTLENITGSLKIIGTMQTEPFPDALASVTVPQCERSIQLLPASDDLDTAPETFWHQLDIADNIPSLTPAISGEFLPHDLNLIQLNAVSFTKGCFTGQEIIARMEYRGKPKKHLFHGESATQLLPGDTFPPSGVVINCCEKVYNQSYLVLFCATEK